MKMGLLSIDETIPLREPHSGIVKLSFKAVDIDEKKEALEQYYHYLKCDAIDITQTKIGSDAIDLIVDDEGLLKDRVVPTFIRSLDGAPLVGNILFTRVNLQEGTEIGLKQEDFPKIAEAVKDSCRRLPNLLEAKFGVNVIYGLHVDLKNVKQPDLQEQSSAIKIQ